MGERIDIDGVRFKVDADLSKLKDGLKEGEKLGKESGQKTATTFSQAFNAVAGAAVAASLKGFFTNAANEFKKVEAAMLRVDSIAKGFGRSVSEARSQVEQLANKGFLNLTQSAESYANAIALGFDEKQARSFIDALSDIAAFQNTIGNGAEAVTSGLAGLLSNSAEKVENIGVPVKVLNQEYQKNVEKLGKAAALQKFYNGILQESSKFAGDAAKATETLTGAQTKYEAATQKAMAAIGKGLEPALRSLYNIGTQVATWFADAFGKLDSLTKTVILAVPAIAAFAGTLATLIPLINPLVAIIAGAVIAFTALTAAAVEYQAKSKPENIVKSYKAAAKETTELVEKIKALEAVNNRTASQELRLIETKEALRKKARELGVDYDMLAAKAKNYSDLLDKIRTAGRDKAAADIDKERVRAGESLRATESLIALAEKEGGKSLLDMRRDGRKLVTITGRGVFGIDDLLTAKERGAARVKTADLERASLFASDEVEAKKPTATAAGGKGSPEFRFIAARDQLRELQREYEAYLKKVGPDSAMGRQATEKLGIEQQAITKQLRGASAEYIEDRYTAEKLAIDAQRDEQIKNVRELVNAKAISEKEAEKKIQEIREANVRKTAQIQAESFARTMQGASMIASGAAGLINARDVGGALGGIGGIAQGFGGLSDRFKALGSIGQGLGAAGAIVSVLGGLFGKSDAERAREAEQQKRRDEEAKALLELQANYQRNMLALQEAQAKLPFENLTRNLRLIDIQAQQQRVNGGDEVAIERQRLAQRQSAIQGVLTEQSATISGDALFGGTQATASGLTSFLNERAAQAVAVGQFMALVNMLADPSMSFSRLRAVASQLESYRGKIPDELFNSAASAISAINGAGFDSLGGATLAEIRDANFFGSTPFSARANAVLSAISPVAGAAGALSSEITRDTGTAENLLSVIEQQLQIQQDIAKNTKVTADKLSETPTRQSSIIDIARGYTRSLGTVLNPSLTNIGLPQSIAAAVLATDIQKTLQERQVKGIEDLVIIQRDSRELLAIIGKSLNSSTNANSALLVQLEDLYRRSLAA